jgi:hypothetical protein
MSGHAFRVLKHQEELAKRAADPMKNRRTREVTALESIAESLKRIADALREEPNRG